MITYNKVDASEPAVAELAKQMKVEPKEVAAIINQQRYRKQYNKVQQARMKVARRLMKEHPELLGEVKP